MNNMRTINSINGRHPIVQTKREVFIEEISTLIWTVDDADGKGRGSHRCRAFSLVVVR